MSDNFSIEDDCNENTTKGLTQLLRENPNIRSAYQHGLGVDVDSHIGRKKPTKETMSLITNKEELSGTCYFELLPGKYQNKFWNDSAVFISEENFVFFEKVIHNIVPDYDHYAFTNISKEDWTPIIETLRSISQQLTIAKNVDELSDVLSLFYQTSQKQLTENFPELNTPLSGLIAETCDWLNRALKSHNSVTVLGI